MHREKYPEKIPFRLTRMLINAMEVSGIEGTFRSTCENVMRVLREHKESLMAVLEAFVYDPLINWRLLTPNSPVQSESTKLKQGKLEQERPDVDPLLNMDSSPSSSFGHKSSPNHRARGRDDKGEDETAMPEVLNERALNVIDRVSKKLTGRDFSNKTLSVEDQVEKLIVQATSHRNLCQCYIGW